MKNTFAVTMTLLLALTLGGSIAGYRIATAEHEEPAAEASQSASESAPSPNSAVTGPADDQATTGDVAAQNEGGTQTGENGAVAAAGGADGADGGVPATSETTPPGGGATAGETGQEPVEQAAAASTAGDVKAGETIYASNCSGCHGADGKGVVGPSLVTADGPKAWTDAQLLTTLREGKTPERQLSTAMPRFTAEQISDSDVTNLHAYIKTLN
ncbi:MULTISPECIES: c-type cytochrome [Deinococcus]|uniref:C-type cytochrome n=1 Tax=Deinococcus rufus TaxID=2136097 RepID=A0ABV7ZDR8_9DEIO|nr:cytochrome c [Deinococcus sp. AB2017081]WQE93719.1 cytochrome c [Deinococcus sp. AB2017081]